ncbi:hypothetical protein LCGC14_1371730 [marine sediment metagenome]|uniref:Nuclease associated modular domain-containing protein n=1 Tax=marine sediment metagenome TaxID=412755 RepID=A0A0F9KRA0_9ZZZZ
MKNKCHRGCGLDSTYINYLNRPCCFDHASKCPTVRQKFSKAARNRPTGHKLTEEHKRKISESLRGRTRPKEVVEKIRKSNIEHWKKNKFIPWNKGKKGVQVAWNKGLRKKESPEILSRDDEAYRNFKKYRNRVQVRTKRTYEKYKKELNPQNYPLTRCGVDGGYQIDHVMSVREGFEKEIKIETISSKENLRVIPWIENIRKYGGNNNRTKNYKMGMMK